MNITTAMTKATKDITFNTLIDKNREAPLTVSLHNRIYIVSTTTEGDKEKVSVKRQECTRKQWMTDFFGRMKRAISGETRALLLQRTIQDTLDVGDDFYCTFKPFLLTNLSTAEKKLLDSSSFQKKAIMEYRQLGTDVIARENTKDRYLPSSTGMFKDIRSISETALDPNLNGNAISFDKNNTIHACSYPKTEQLPDYFKMLMGNQNKPEQTSCIVVINSENELSKTNKNGELVKKPYFRENFDKPNCNISTISTYQKELTEGTYLYHLQITDKTAEQTVTIPVIHVFDWEDKTPRDNKKLQELSQLTQQYKRPIGETLVHCSAGVGRTGQFIGIDFINRNPKSEETAYSLTTKMRKQRNDIMVQTPGQYMMLLLAEQLKSSSPQTPEKKSSGTLLNQRQPIIDNHLSEQKKPEPILATKTENKGNESAGKMTKAISPELPPKSLNAKELQKLYVRQEPTTTENISVTNKSQDKQYFLKYSYLMQELNRQQQKSRSH